MQKAVLKSVDAYFRLLWLKMFLILPYSRWNYYYLFKYYLKSKKLPTNEVKKQNIRLNGIQIRTQ